jgi:hypothetical protein
VILTGCAFWGRSASLIHRFQPAAINALGWLIFALLLFLAIMTCMKVAATYAVSLSNEARQGRRHEKTSVRTDAKPFFACSENPFKTRARKLVVTFALMATAAYAVDHLQGHSEQ